MRKRILCVLLTVLLLTALLPVSAAGTVLEIKTPSTLPGAGESFTVTVEIRGNPGFCAVQFTLTYDKSALECTDADLGRVLSGMLAATNPAASGGAIIAAASAMPVEGDGVLAEFTFRVKQAAESFAFALSAVDLTDGSGNEIPFTVTTGAFAEPPQTPGGQPQTPGVPAQGGTAPEEPEIALAGEFTDMANHWSEPYVKRAVAMGLFTGYPDGTFKPNETISRADFVTVLWRASGSPEPQADAPFADVPANAYYAKAVAWAKENGYVDGVSAAAFDPRGVLQRQAAMSILFRYSGGQSGMELMFGSMYDSGFADSASIAPWAKAAMYWGYYNGIISGVGENLLSPTTGATRAQLAKILVNYLDANGSN